MKDYEELYYESRSKYYNACEQINACDRMITSCQEQRRSKVDRINELNSSNRKIRDAIANLKEVLKREDKVTEKLSKVSEKLDTASVNFSGMVKDSNVSNKSLTDVFSGETSGTKTAISGVFETVKTRKTALETNLENQERELQRTKDELSDLDTQIRNWKNARSDWKREKTNSYYNMEYYKRKMNEEGYY